MGSEETIAEDFKGGISQLAQQSMEYLSPIHDAEYHFSPKPDSELEKLEPFGPPIWPDGISPTWPSNQPDFPNQNEGPSMLERSGYEERPLIIVSMDTPEEVEN